LNRELAFKYAPCSDVRMPTPQNISTDISLAVTVVLHNKFSLPNTQRFPPTVVMVLHLLCVLCINVCIPYVYCVDVLWLNVSK